MKLIWKCLTYGVFGLGGLILLSVAISVSQPEAVGGTDRIRFDAVRNAVDKALGDMAAEKREAEVAAERAAYETELSAAHSEVLLTMHEFDVASQNLTCVRQQALANKIDAQKAQGISFESALKDELTRLQIRWQEWRQHSNGALSGEAELIGKSRAIIGDTRALLGIAAAYYNGEALPMCDESLDIEIHNLAQTTTAVVASFDRREQLIQGFESEQAIAANWHQFRQTGNPVYRRNIERLAAEHDVDLAALGIDLDTIAVVGE